MRFGMLICASKLRFLSAFRLAWPALATRQTDF
jgi:hypothetical protein